MNTSFGGRRSARRVIGAVIAASLVFAVAPAGASSTVRTSGKGTSFGIGWTELDPDDVLGLPGNVHIGSLWAEDGPWGRYVNGFVIDWECPSGELPSGHGHFAEAVVAETVDVAADASADAVTEIIASGATTIDPDVVTEAVSDGITIDVPEELLDEFPPNPCTHIGVRGLSGFDPDTGEQLATVEVDVKKKTATISGRLIVTGGHGDHGEPGPELGRPPVNATITGGDWENYESSYKVEGRDYKYSSWYKGTSYYNGIVSGSIGAMGFADDPDDTSHGYYSAFSFRSVERIR